MALTREQYKELKEARFEKGKENKEAEEERLVELEHRIENLEGD